MNSDEIARRRAHQTLAKVVLDRVATPKQQALAALMEAETKAKTPGKRPSRALLDVLSGPLDARIDVVTVTPIGATVTFGDAKLKD